MRKYCAVVVVVTIVVRLASIGIHCKEGETQQKGYQITHLPVYWVGPGGDGAKGDGGGKYGDIWTPPSRQFRSYSYEDKSYNDDYYYGHGEDGHDDDDESEEDIDAKIRRKPSFKKFERIEKLKMKVYNKFLVKYLHIKQDKPPKPPRWAVEEAQASRRHELGPLDPVLPPWETLYPNGY